MAKTSADWLGGNSDFKFGYAAGGGAEYALSDRASFKLDGLYYDLATISATASGTGTGTTGLPLAVAPYEVKTDLNGIATRLGFNFKF